MTDLSNRRDHGEGPLNFKAAGFPDPRGRRSMATRENLDQPGISVAPNGSLVVRYINGDGQRVTLDLSAYIEQKAEESVQAHVRHLHGQSI